MFSDFLLTQWIFIYNKMEKETPLLNKVHILVSFLDLDPILLYPPLRSEPVTFCPWVSYWSLLSQLFSCQLKASKVEN